MYKAFKYISLEVHRSMVTLFCVRPKSESDAVNVDKRLMTALFAIPNTRLVKVMNAVGFGTSKISTFSTRNKKLLAFFGKGGEHWGPLRY